ncbi:hypothetical protein ACP76Z_02545 [Vibrio cholerae]
MLVIRLMPLLDVSVVHCRISKLIGELFPPQQAHHQPCPSRDRNRLCRRSGSVQRKSVAVSERERDDDSRAKRSLKNRWGRRVANHRKLFINIENLCSQPDSIINCLASGQLHGVKSAETCANSVLRFTIHKPKNIYHEIADNIEAYRVTIRPTLRLGKKRHTTFGNVSLDRISATIREQSAIVISINSVEVIYHHLGSRSLAELVFNSCSVVSDFCYSEVPILKKRHRREVLVRVASGLPEHAIANHPPCGELAGRGLVPCKTIRFGDLMPIGQKKKKINK